MNLLREEVKKIELTKEAKERIMENCRIKMEAENEKRKKKQLVDFYKKPLVVAAMLAVCFCLTGITVLAANEKLQGYFQDVKRFDGAITGTNYQNATNELFVSTTVEGDVLVIAVEMLYPETIPYSEIEVLGLKDYRVLDEMGNTVLKNVEPDNVVTKNNQVIFQISAEKLTEGTYRLELDALSGSKKADQDLLIYGNWECEFTK